MLPLMLQFWMKISLTSMKTKFAEKSYLYIDSLYHNSSLGVIADDNDDLFVRKWLLHRDVLMCLMKTLLTSRCINQRGAGHRAAYPEDKFLFQSKSNRVKNQRPRAITRESASRAFSEAGEMVTEKNISSHSARKCRGRALWEAGTPIETISKMLNHSSPAVTMTYLDITQDEVNQTYY